MRRMSLPLLAIWIIWLIWFTGNVCLVQRRRSGFLLSFPTAVPCSSSEKLFVENSAIHSIIDTWTDIDDHKHFILFNNNQEMSCALVTGIFPNRRKAKVELLRTFFDFASIYSTNCEKEAQ